MNLYKLVSEIKNMDESAANILKNIGECLDDIDNFSLKDLHKLVSEYSAVLTRLSKFERVRTISESLSKISPGSNITLLEARYDKKSILEIHDLYGKIHNAMQLAGFKEDFLEGVLSIQSNLSANIEDIEKMLSEAYARTTVIDVEIEEGLKEGMVPVETVSRKKKRKLPPRRNSGDLAGLGLDEGRIFEIERQMEHKPRMSDPACPLTNWGRRNRLDAVITESHGNMDTILTWLDRNRMSLPASTVRRYVDKNFPDMGYGSYTSYDPEAHNMHLD